MNTDATTCPEGHTDCTNISEPIMDLMPDQMYQLYYCPYCERTYEVEYKPSLPVFLKEKQHERNS